MIMKKRFIYFAFSVLMLVSSVLTSCAGGSSDDTAVPDTSSAEVTEAENVSLTDRLGERDFEGKRFAIYDCNEVPDKLKNIPAEELTGDPVEDALFMRDTDIETMYNVTVDYMQVNAPDTAFQNSILAGDDAYQMVISNGSYTGKTLTTANVLKDLKSMPYIELEEAWWSRLMAENMQINGKQYITIGDIAPAMYQAVMCLYLNTDLAADYSINVDDIFSTVIGGKWTLDELSKLTKDMDTDLNQNNAMEARHDFFGIAMTQSNEVSNALLAGSGVNLNIIEDGIPKINEFDNEADVNKIQKIQTITKKYVYENINDTINFAFKGGKALFLIHKLESAANQLRDMEDPYLILPVPKYDEIQENYVSAISESSYCFIGVPITADDEFTGFMMEAMGRYSYEKIRPLAYDLVYTQKLVRDERSNEVLEILFDTVTMELMAVYNFGGLTLEIRNVVYGNKELASTVAASIDAARAALNTLIEELE